MPLSAYNAQDSATPKHHPMQNVNGAEVEKSYSYALFRKEPSPGSWKYLSAKINVSSPHTVIRSVTQIFVRTLYSTGLWPARGRYTLIRNHDLPCRDHWYDSSHPWPAGPSHAIGLPTGPKMPGAK